MEQHDNLMISTKDVIIDDVVLETEIGEITLIYIFSEIQLFEDIHAPTMTLEISISESRNLPELSNLRGGEKLTLKYRTAGFEDNVELTFYLNKISERIITKDKHALYNLSFVSKEAVYDVIHKVQRGYDSDSIINQYIRDVLYNTEYGCASEKEIAEEEESIYLHKMVIPSWGPLKTIMWMKNRCVSALYTGSPFFFFENKKGFVLSSMENLFSKPINQQYIYSPKLDYEERDISEDFRKVESYMVKNSLDFLKRLARGGESSSLMTFDFVTKRLTEYQYSYENNNTRRLSTEQGNNVALPLTFDGNNLKEKFLASRTFGFKHTELDEGNNYIEAWSQARDSNLTNLESICLELSLAGDSDLNVGDVVEFLAPTYGAGDNEIDEVISGKYLVTAMTHYITRKEYNMKIEICKDSFFRQLSGQGFDK